MLESDAAEIRGRVLCPISDGCVSLASEMSGVSVFELLQYDATETSNQSGERRVQKLKRSKRRNKLNINFE